MGKDSTWELEWESMILLVMDTYIGFRKPDAPFNSRRKLILLCTDSLRREASSVGKISGY